MVFSSHLSQLGSIRLTSGLTCNLSNARVARPWLQLRRHWCGDITMEPLITRIPRQRELFFVSLQSSSYRSSTNKLFQALVHPVQLQTMPGSLTIEVSLTLQSQYWRLKCYTLMFKAWVSCWLLNREPFEDPFRKLDLSAVFAWLCFANKRLQRLVRDRIYHRGVKFFCEESLHTNLVTLIVLLGLYLTLIF